MGRKRTQPKLRIVRGKYYCTDVYLPNGNRTTIGFGTTESRTKGEIMVAFEKWLDLFGQQPHKVLSFKNPYVAIQEIVNPNKQITVKELLQKYRNHASKTIAKVDSNKKHPDYTFIDRVDKFLKPYMDWPAKDFGPDELLAVQKAMIQHRYCIGGKEKRYTRRGINDNINWIRKIWKWGMGRCIVTAEQVQGFEEVKPLRIGTSLAPDNVKRKRVTEEELENVINCLGSVVGDMLSIISYTGMRPSEVCKIRPYDIIRDDKDCWLYIPGRDHSPVGKHKTMRFERTKVIPLAGESQDVLKKRIKDFNSKDFIFSPKETVAELIAKKARERKTPLSCGNRPGTNRKDHPMIKPRDCYDHHTLRRACQRACKKAGVELFVPYDLRRSMATRTRATLGKEATKVLLGHAKTSTTEIYLLEEVQEAVKVAKLLASNSS
ncbi:tyrosine-type recombinase/integrase [Planctomycetota bacterium]